MMGAMMVDGRGTIVVAVWQPHGAVELPSSATAKYFCGGSAHAGAPPSKGVAGVPPVQQELSPPEHSWVKRGKGAPKPSPGIGQYWLGRTTSSLPWQGCWFEGSIWSFPSGAHHVISRDQQAQTKFALPNESHRTTDSPNLSFFF